MHDPRKQTIEARAIALAALVQAARLVDDIARKGSCDAEDFHILTDSLFVSTSHAPAELYGGTDKVRVGLKICTRVLSGENMERTKVLMGYVAGLMALERRLARQPQMLAGIAEGLDRIRRQSDYFGSHVHENIIASIASLYGETLSTLKPRIIVRGKQEHLRQSANTNRVRTMLFAGIRAAYLWREYGGSRLTLILQRKALLRECEALLTGHAPL